MNSLARVREKKKGAKEVLKGRRGRVRHSRVSERSKERKRSDDYYTMEDECHENVIE